MGRRPLLACCRIARSAAAKLLPFPLPEAVAAHAAHVVVFRARMPLHLFSVYVPAGGSSASAKLCNSVSQAVLSEAAAIGQQPCLLARDFNFDPLPPLAAALLAVSGWVDMAEHLGPTTAPGEGRRGAG